MARTKQLKMSDNIKVAIRVRPLITREVQNNASVYWEVKNKRNVAQVKGGSENFFFDRVFKTEEKNVDVYTDLCQPIVKSVVQGFNGTIFAYGQTSSGKTFTMMGEHGGIYKGVIQYTIEDVFDMIQQMQDKEFLLRVSVIEIYNEKIYDLLSSSKNEDLKLQEDLDRVVTIKGLTEKIVQNPDQIWDIIHEGQTKRQTGETEMNRSCSRSHFIFRMILESSLKGEEDPAVNVSQLNLVDLAGSENVKQTKSKGHQFKEGIHINLSLSALSQVISQLSEKPDQFINYRDSKLTRLLQNSLGGNAVTAIICAVTPASLKETLSTLNFASRAKKIKNKPEKIEVLNDQALLKQYANKIKKLSELLEASKAKGKELEEIQKQNEDLKRQIETLKANFVSQTVETKAKAARRETWGGRLDSKRFFPEPRNTREEIDDTNEAMFSESTETYCKEARNSRSSASFSYNQYFNDGVNIGIQTDLKWMEQNEETMALDLNGAITKCEDVNELALNKLQALSKENLILKEKLSSILPCKCKSVSKESKSDSVDENEDKKSGKMKMTLKDDLDGAATNQAPKKTSHSDFETPQKKVCGAEQNCICIGGGSGPANIVKNLWLEGIIAKRDKEISKLRKELAEVYSQLTIMKSQLHILEGKETEAKEIVKKSDKPKLPISDLHKLNVSNSPLQERDENQMSNHPYKDKIPQVQKKQNLRENEITRSKPYENFQRKENVALEMQHENHDANVNTYRIETKEQAFDMLQNPECKQATGNYYRL